MKKFLITLAFLLFVSSAFADVYVQGYTKDNGTYVNPYHRSSPNQSTSDNYSTKGNTNPYTGQQGYVDPYSSRSNLNHTFKSNGFWN